MWGARILQQLLPPSLRAVGATKEGAGGVPVGSDISQENLGAVSMGMGAGLRGLTGSGPATWGDAGRPEGAEPQRVGGCRDSAKQAGGSGKKRRYRWRKTGRRWEWQGPWEAGRQEPGESAWWGALKFGREAQAGQVLPQPGEPSSPGWHPLHPSFPAQPRKADCLQTRVACGATALSFRDNAGMEPPWLHPLQ